MLVKKKAFQMLRLITQGRRKERGEVLPRGAYEHVRKKFAKDTKGIGHSKHRSWTGQDC